MAELVSSRVYGGAEPLPPVAMAFLQVDGGASLARRKPEVARVVHNVLCRLLHVLLMALPEQMGPQDGYMCREMPGELKYMVAFREPARAVEWALMLQVRGCVSMLRPARPRMLCSCETAAMLTAPAPALWLHRR